MLQYNLPHSGQDVANSSILIDANDRKLQEVVFKLGFAISIGTVGVLLSGQTQPVFAVEPVETNLVGEGSSEDFVIDQGEQISSAILRQKVNRQDSIGGVDDSLNNQGNIDTAQGKENTVKLQLQQKTDRFRADLAQLGSEQIDSVSDNVRGAAKRYKVKPGDTLASIALRHQVSIADIVAANKLINPHQLKISQVLIIPEPKLVAAENYSGVGGNTPIPPAIAEIQPTSQNRQTGIISQNSGLSILNTEIESLRQQYRTQQSHYQQTAPININSNHSVPIAVPRYNQNSATVVIPVPAPLTQPSHRHPATTPTPVASANIPKLPPLAAVDRYLPQVIDENAAPPIAPGTTNTAYIWPATGILTSGYGMRWGRMHRGIDIANKIGTPIVAAAAGVVEFEGKKRGYGNLIDIRHLDGSLTRYAHNHRHFVTVGQKVQQGEMIAHMGNTGFSSGSHLHFEIHPAGKGAVNPVAYLPPRV
ncbi:peptidoglycan DD-metalloendopeptidase family protein [Calothrix sp. NIES-3974]|uniref:peptidoglycan DD-metalloendopeptidase family protein n=1 Tax=Calothrix sp. NIES-3974 TaxID=2005462 RepID=UPI001E565D75|nr:M23 family metallopeptidase [Calothrix sp. NIES-3974]